MTAMSKPWLRCWARSSSLMDTADVIPVRASIVAAEREGYTVSLDVTGIDQVELVGAVPKAASLHDLRFEERPDGWWSCGVTLDV